MKMYKKSLRSEHLQFADCMCTVCTVLCWYLPIWQSFQFYYYEFLEAAMLSKQFCFEVSVCVFPKFFCSHVSFRCLATEQNR